MIDNIDTLNITAIVAGLFADFINPENRGPNFKWENFPDLAWKLSNIQLYYEYPLSENKLKVFEQYTKNLARNYLSRAGLI
jgi:hypothetical protein